MSLRTAEGLEGEKVVQFSIFLENRVGRLLDLVRLLDSHGIHLLALSVVDTIDAAIDRFITDDPEKTRQVLSEYGWVFVESTMVVVSIPGPSAFKSVLVALLQGECNLHFTYPFMSHPEGQTALALHVEDDECASSVLRSAGFNVLSQKDISR
jgi:hypothetical protein